MYIYLRALRASATVPGTSSQATRQPANQRTSQPDQKPTKLDPKIHQVGVQNPPKSVLGGLLEGSWGHLGAILDARWPQERKPPPKVNNSYASWGPSWRPKSTKTRSQDDPRCDHFFDQLVGRFLKPLGINLRPTWLPKPLQNGAKLGTKSIKPGDTSSNCRGHENIEKTNGF